MSIFQIDKQTNKKQSHVENLLLLSGHDFAILYPGIPYISFHHYLNSPWMNTKSDLHGGKDSIFKIWDIHRPLGRKELFLAHVRNCIWTMAQPSHSQIKFQSYQLQ